MARDPGNIWFARLPGGGAKMVPVNRRGYGVVAIFVAGMFASGGAALVLGLLFGAPPWVWIPLMAGGYIASAIFFIVTAWRHTDHTKTIADYKKDQSNA